MSPTIDLQVKFPVVDEQLSALHARAGAHAFLLDTAVDSDRQRSGIGARLVRAIVDETTAAGCGWLHVDYEPHLRLVLHRGMRVSSTSAGLRRLTSG